MEPPTIADVLAAQRLLAPHLPPTPTWNYPALDAATGATVFVKHENAQPTGAFKVRGGITLLSRLEPAVRERGVVGYSTGNHAQSLAYAARLFGVPCTIVMPEHPNPAKADAVRRLGAELVEYGATFDDAAPHARSLAAERGMRLVSAADEPDIIAGVATAYLELFAQQPHLDAVVVPVGSGSGAAAACLVAAALAPDCEVIAVQATASPAAFESWQAGGELVRRPNRTAVEGLATGSGFALPQRILRDRLADFVLVGDDAIAAAQWQLMRDAHTLAEGAGAAALAAVLADPDRFAGRRVAVACTGGNASEAELRRCATTRAPHAAAVVDEAEAVATSQ
jgi:threonine dehydratase